MSLEAAEEPRCDADGWVRQPSRPAPGGFIGHGKPNMRTNGATLLGSAMGGFLATRQKGYMAMSVDRAEQRLESSSI